MSSGKSIWKNPSGKMSSGKIDLEKCDLEKPIWNIDLEKLQAKKFTQTIHLHILYRTTYRNSLY